MSHECTRDQDPPIQRANDAHGTFAADDFKLIRIRRVGGSIRRSMNRSDYRMRENVCRRLPSARRRQKYEPGLTIISALRWGGGTTLTTRSQLTVTNRKQWPTSSTVGYLMSPSPPKTSSLPQRRVRPRTGNKLCEGHDRRIEWAIQIIASAQVPMALDIHDVKAADKWRQFF